jgi:hypothetical protein
LLREVKEFPAVFFGCGNESTPLRCIGSHADRLFRLRAVQVAVRLTARLQLLEQTRLRARVR